MTWRKASGVICDRRLPARVKGKVCSSVVIPAMVYGLETMAVTQTQVKEMKVAEMKMLWFAMTRKDKIRNWYIKATVMVEQLGMKMREGRLRWTCHEERLGICRKKGDENGVTGKEKKRTRKEKSFRCSEGRYRKSWCKGEGHCKQDSLEKHDTLWLPLTKGKGQKKKNKNQQGWQ